MITFVVVMKVSTHWGPQEFGNHCLPRRAGSPGKSPGSEAFPSRPTGSDLSVFRPPFPAPAWSAFRCHDLMASAETRNLPLQKRLPGFPLIWVFSAVFSGECRCNAAQLKRRNYVAAGTPPSLPVLHTAAKKWAFPPKWSFSEYNSFSRSWQFCNHSSMQLHHCSLLPTLFG